MSLRTSIYACILILGSATAGRAKLRIEPLTGYIDLNEDRVFICKVEGEAEELRWFDKLGEDIDLDANGRFTLERSEYDLQLQIRNAQWEDSGIYKCRAETENGDEIEKSINITVIRRPKLRIEPLTGNIDLNKDKVFICKVEGEAEELRWFDKLGEEIDQDANGRFTLERSEYNLLLKIRNAEDSGIYKYTAETEDGDEIEKSINIKVIHRFQKQNNNSLMIRNIQPSDAGIYFRGGKIAARDEQESANITGKVKNRFQKQNNNNQMNRNMQPSDAGTYFSGRTTTARDEQESTTITGNNNNRFQNQNNNNQMNRNMQPSVAGTYFSGRTTTARDEQESTTKSGNNNYAPRLEFLASEVFTLLLILLLV